MQEDINRFQISVENTLLFQFDQTLKDLACIHDDMICRKGITVIGNAIFKCTVIAHFHNETCVSDPLLFLSCKKFVKELLILLFLRILVDQFDHLDDSVRFFHNLITQILSSYLTDFLNVLIINLIGLSLLLFFLTKVRDSFK